MHGQAVLNCAMSDSNETQITYVLFCYSADAQSTCQRSTRLTLVGRVEQMYNKSKANSRPSDFLLRAATVNVFIHHLYYLFLWCMIQVIYSIQVSDLLELTLPRN